MRAREWMRASVRKSALAVMTFVLALSGSGAALAAHGAPPSGTQAPQQAALTAAAGRHGSTSGSGDAFVGLIGDVSCDAPPIAPADARALVDLGLNAVAKSAPAELLVTSVRGHAPTTVKPAAVRLASGITGDMARERELEKQKKAVALAPLVAALTTPPSDACGTDVISSIRVLRDVAANGTNGLCKAKTAWMTHASDDMVSIVLNQSGTMIPWRQQSGRSCAVSGSLPPVESVSDATVPRTRA